MRLAWSGDETRAAYRCGRRERGEVPVLREGRVDLVRIGIVEAGVRHRGPQVVVAQDPHDATEILEGVLVEPQKTKRVRTWRPVDYNPESFDRWAIDCALSLVMGWGAI